MSRQSWATAVACALIALLLLGRIVWVHTDEPDPIATPGAVVTVLPTATATFVTPERLTRVPTATEPVDGVLWRATATPTPVPPLVLPSFTPSPTGTPVPGTRVPVQKGGRAWSPV